MLGKCPEAIKISRIADRSVALCHTHIMLKKVVRKFISRNYLTARHGFASRWLLAYSAFTVALAETQDYVLASDIKKQMSADKYTVGLSRLAWYIRRRHGRVDPSLDPLHMFCADLTTSQLKAMRRFLLRHNQKTDPETLLGELCFLSACTAIQTSDTPEYDANMDQLRKDADALLGLVLTPVPPATPRDEKSTRGARANFSSDGGLVALRDVLDLLQTAGFPPFILSGTLLGAVREGKLLDHDYDIDLGLFAADTDIPRLEALLADCQPFICISTEYQTLIGPERDCPVRRDVPVLYKLRHESGILIDLFLHYREGGKSWHGTALYRWESTCFDLSHRHLADVQVLAPTDAALNLSENYGNWHDPQHSFHCALDTPNLALHASPLSLAVAVRRLGLLKSRPKDAAKLLDQMAAVGFVERDKTQGWRVSRNVFSGIDPTDNQPLMAATN